MYTKNILFIFLTYQNYLKIANKIKMSSSFSYNKYYYHIFPNKNSHRYNCQFRPNIQRYFINVITTNLLKNIKLCLHLLINIEIKIRWILKSNKIITTVIVVNNINLLQNLIMHISDNQLKVKCLINPS
jgi:hypothetical protein